MHERAQRRSLLARLPADWLFWLARNRPGKRVRWGTLRRTVPFSENWGFERGAPVDRAYVDAFLKSNSWAIHGSVLEVQRDLYTTRFGGSAVTAVTIVDIDAGNPEASLVLDLCDPSSLPRERFDCIILTQTLQYLADLDTAFANLWAALAPRGVLLLTVPALAREKPLGADYWRFTPSGLARLLRTVLPPEADISVVGYGNVLAGMACLFGLVVEDVGEEAVAVHDPSNAVIACARITRP